MNINVTVDDVTLDTVIRELGYDEDHAPVPVTIGDQVAMMIVDRLVRDTERWSHLQRQLSEIREEIIRAKIEPVIDEALTRPLRPTDSFGNATGPETTLEALIMARVDKELRAQENYSKDTLLTKTLRPIVIKALEEQVAAITEAVKAEISDTYAGVIVKAVTKAVTGR